MPCDLLLAFLPLDLISERFHAWRQHAEAAGRAGLKNIDRPMFLRVLPHSLGGACLVSEGGNCTSEKANAQHFHSAPLRTFCTL
jgi:hypothetical protein